MGLRTSPTEGSNGLVEKGAISPTNATESPTHIPHKVSNQRKERENISQSPVLNTEAARSFDKSSEEAATPIGRIRADEPSVVSLQSLGKEDSLLDSLKDHEDSEKSSSPVLAKATSEEIFPCQLTKVTSSTTPPHLPDAKRPEPEGEVAKHHSPVNPEDEIIVCAVSPTKVQRVNPLKDSSLEMPVSVQDFHQHILTSTPTFPDPASVALAMVQDTTASSVTAEDTPVHCSSGKELDLELLASGLISEVISAATQEVLGVSSCAITDNSQPSCSGNRPVGGGRLHFQPELSAVAQQHHHLLTSPSQTDSESREEEGVEEHGLPNGCSLLSQRVRQTNKAQTGHWPTASHQVAQSACLLNMKLKGDEAAVLAEDSACSTCHSEDGIGGEDIQNSMLDNQMDVIQVTELSAREATQPQSPVEPTTDAAVLPETKDDSMDAVCDIKRLNGMGLRNGGHGTCEVETDQSGGETPFF